MVVKLYTAKSKGGLFRIPVQYTVWVDDKGYFGVTTPGMGMPYCAYKNIDAMLKLKGLGRQNLMRLQYN